MKIDSVLKPKHMGWASGAVLAVILLIVLTRSGTKASVQAPPPPIVEVATVEQRDGPVYGEWIGTLTGQVNADVKAQVTGYRSTQINASAAPGYSSDQATAALEDVFMQTMPHEMGFDYLGMSYQEQKVAGGRTSFGHFRIFDPVRFSDPGSAL